MKTCKNQRLYSGELLYKGQHQPDFLDHAAGDIDAGRLANFSEDFIRAGYFYPMQELRAERMIQPYARLESTQQNLVGIEFWGDNGKDLLSRKDRAAQAVIEYDISINDRDQVRRER